MLLYGLKVHDEHENKTVEGATSIMDQLAVLGEEISGLYHMHDILLKFVKENSEERPTFTKAVFGGGRPTSPA